jgi:alpha-tubulin suppressor-like RCC1 family protein
VLDANQQVYCWGSNPSGQLGVGGGSTTTPTKRATQQATAIGAGGAHTCALVVSKNVQCWGSNQTGQLGRGGSTDTAAHSDTLPVQSAAGQPLVATQIGVGRDHACAVTDNGTVACWGLNQDGQLGNTQFGGPQTLPVAVVAAQ